MSKNPGSERKLAKKYAEALISSCSKKEELELVGNDIQNLLAIFSEKDNALEKLSYTYVQKEIFEEILQIIKKELSLQEKTISFLRLLQENSRTNILEKSLEVFIPLYRKKLDIISAEISSNNKINQSELDEIENIISKKYNKKVIISQNIDENILGGFKLCLNENLTIDCSVDRYLESLKDELSSKVLQLD